MNCALCGKSRSHVIHVPRGRNFASHEFQPVVGNPNTRYSVGQYDSKWGIVDHETDRIALFGAEYKNLAHEEAILLNTQVKDPVSWYWTPRRE